MTKPFLPSLFLATLMFLAACNTTEGVGKDLQSAGDEVEKVADRNK
jgi:predicted small secreted protein